MKMLERGKITQGGWVFDLDGIGFERWIYGYWWKENCNDKKQIARWNRVTGESDIAHTPAIDICESIECNLLSSRDLDSSYVWSVRKKWWHEYTFVLIGAVEYKFVLVSMNNSDSGEHLCSQALSHCMVSYEELAKEWEFIESYDHKGGRVRKSFPCTLQGLKDFRKWQNERSYDSL